MASSFVVKGLVASTTRRSLPVVVPYFHRPAALLATTYSSRRAFATTPYSYEHTRIEAKRLWFNFTGFFNRFSPYKHLEKIIDMLAKTPHTLRMTHDSQLEASGDIFGGHRISLDFPGIEEMKETDEEVRIVVDTGLGNLLNDFTRRTGSIKTDPDYTVLTIDMALRDNEHKQGICNCRIDLPAGLKDPKCETDPKWETETTKDGLLIITFSKVKQVEPRIGAKVNSVKWLD